MGLCGRRRMQMTKHEPLFLCDLCAEEDGMFDSTCHTATELREYDGRLICEDCYEYANLCMFGENGDAKKAQWADLPEFVPEWEARVKELEGENERLRHDRAGWAARSQEQFDRIGKALRLIRQKRTTGEPSRDDATEIESIVAKVAALQARAKELEAALNGVLASYENRVMEEKPEPDDEYDSMMMPRWAAARAAITQDEEWAADAALGRMVREMPPSSALYHGVSGLWELTDQDDRWTSGIKRSPEDALAGRKDQA